MGEMSVSEAWTLILAIVSAFMLMANAVEKIVKAWKMAKAPNDLQNERLRELEEWRKSVDRKLENDKHELSTSHDGLQASFQAQLALLDHGIDGNNIDQMQKAKAVLQQHLISKT